MKLVASKAAHAVQGAAAQKAAAAEARAAAEAAAAAVVVATSSQTRRCSTGCAACWSQLGPQGTRKLEAALAAAVQWLIQAPALSMLTWQADIHGPAALSASTLQVFAHHGIQRTTFESLTWLGSAAACIWHAGSRPVIRELSALAMEVVLKHN